MKSWALLVVVIALVGCSTTSEPAPEPDAQVSAALSAQAVERACSNACQTYEIVYVRDELVNIGGSAGEMPMKTRSAIADLFDGIQFARGQALDDLFGDDALFAGGEGILISVGPVEELAEGVVGIDVGLATARYGYHGETYLFQWDGSNWSPATPQDTGVTVTSSVS
ncbi:MAG: hypothetical protein WD274_07215 [Acidimicrobiia bacterium]